MRNATTSQPPTLLGDVRCCGQGIRLPSVSRADHMVYARADAERIRVGNSETVRYLSLQSIRLTGRPNTLPDVRSSNIDQSRKGFRLSWPALFRKMRATMRLSRGHATGVLTVYHGCKRA